MLESQEVILQNQTFEFLRSVPLETLCEISSPEAEVRCGRHAIFSDILADEGREVHLFLFPTNTIFNHLQHFVHNVPSEIRDAHEGRWIFYIGQVDRDEEKGCLSSDGIYVEVEERVTNAIKTYFISGEEQDTARSTIEREHFDDREFQEFIDNIQMLNEAIIQRYGENVENDELALLFENPRRIRCPIPRPRITNEPLKEAETDSQLDIAIQKPSENNLSFTIGHEPLSKRISDMIYVPSPRSNISVGGEEDPDSDPGFYVFKQFSERTAQSITYFDLVRRFSFDDRSYSNFQHQIDQRVVQNTYDQVEIFAGMGYAPKMDRMYRDIQIAVLLNTWKKEITDAYLSTEYKLPSFVEMRNGNQSVVFRTNQHFLEAGFLNDDLARKYVPTLDGEIRLPVLVESENERNVMFMNQNELRLFWQFFVNGGSVDMYSLENEYPGVDFQLVMEQFAPRLNRFMRRNNFWSREDEFFSTSSFEVVTETEEERVERILGKVCYASGIPLRENYVVTDIVVRYLRDPDMLEYRIYTPAQRRYCERLLDSLESREVISLYDLGDEAERHWATVRDVLIEAVKRYDNRDSIFLYASSKEYIPQDSVLRRILETGVEEIVTKLHDYLTPLQTEVLNLLVSTHRHEMPTLTELGLFVKGGREKPYSAPFVSFTLEFIEQLVGAVDSGEYFIVEKSKDPDNNVICTVRRLRQDSQRLTMLKVTQTDVEKSSRPKTLKRNLQILKYLNTIRGHRFEYEAREIATLMGIKPGDVYNFLNKFTNKQENEL